MQDNGSPPPFRDTIRERSAVAVAVAALAEFKDKRPGFTDRDWAAWTGTLSATAEELLEVVANLQAVADHAEDGAR